MSPKRRIIVVGLVGNKDGELLSCKMAQDQGVFSGQGGLPAGGVEKGEKFYRHCAANCEKKLELKLNILNPHSSKTVNMKRPLPMAQNKRSI